MLVPSLKGQEERINRIQTDINKWLFYQYKNKLYLGLAYEKASVKDFGYQTANEQPLPVDSLFACLLGKLAKDKLNGYTLEDLKEMMRPAEKENNGRECTVCGRTDLLAEDVKLGTVCRSCQSLYALGDAIVRKNEKDTSVTVEI